ncbi:MAG TPA: DUF2834 domain-containing protein [Candidatus Sericytochromatia bacterium]
MARKVILWLIWAAFIAYTLSLAPLEQPGTLTTIGKLVTFQLEGINPYVITLFSLMGVWPMVYACLMFIDEQMQDIPALPSFLASNGSGVIGMIPYLILREPSQEFSGHKNFFLETLDSHITGIALTLTTVGLVAYAIITGDFGDFVHQFQTSHFIHLMSWDFCLMYLVFPSLLGDDMARRGLRNSGIFWAVALVPLFGPLTYLCLRPRLPEASADLAVS